MKSSTAMFISVGIVLGIVFLAANKLSSQWRDFSADCEAKGGVAKSFHGDLVCFRKEALLSTH